jgi:hypothetical protein
MKELYFVQCFFALHFLFTVYKKEIRRATKNRQTAYGDGKRLVFGVNDLCSGAFLSLKKAHLDKV